MRMEEQEYDLQLYKGKNGYRWRFMINGDIKCVGTDWKKSMKEAFDDAANILDNVWNIGEFPGNEDGDEGRG